MNFWNVKLPYLALCLIFPFSVLAQNFSVKGIVADKLNNDPLPGATATLFNSDSSYLRKSITDLNGAFSFAAPEGALTLHVSFIGFKPYSGSIQVNSEINLDTIYLSEDVQTLNEVVVEGKIPPSVQKGDTTQFNAGAYKTNPDATASDLIGKMPGMTERNGRVQAQGEDVQQVLVDGKPFFGNDANATLKNVPAEMIDKVEVYDQQSEQSQFTGVDDGETKKTINIVTKKAYRNGKFGNVYAGYGINDRYQGGGVLNSFNGTQRLTIIGQINNINQQNFSNQDLSGMSGGSGGGRGGYRRRSSSGVDVDDFIVDQQGGISQTNAVGINFSDEIGKKLKINASYFFNYTDNSMENLLFRNYFSEGDTGQVYQEQEMASSKSSNHRINVRLDYTLDENNEILFRPELSFQNNEGVSILNARTNTDNQLLNTIDRDFNSSLNASYYSNYILWNHKFKKEGRTLSTRVENEFNNTDAQSNLYSENIYYVRGEADTLNQYSNLEQFEQEHELRLRYTEPLSEDVFLQLSYEPEYNFNTADKKTYNQLDNNEFSRDSALSNEVSSSYHIEAFETGIRYKKEKLYFSLRGSIQYAVLQADQVFPYELKTYNKYFNFLPSVSLRYKFTDKKQLRIHYRNRTSPPKISQLQEVLDNSNPIQLRIGNSNLDQESEHRLFAHYSTGNTEKETFFFQMLRASLINNYIANSSYIANNDTTVYGVLLQPGVQLSRPVNVDGYWNIGSHSTFSKPVKALKSNLNVSLDLDYSRNPGLINGEKNFVHNPSFGIDVGLSSNISEKLDFSINTTSSQNYSLNTLNTNLDTRYFNQSTRVRLYWNFWKTVFYRTDLRHEYYQGLSSSFDNNFILWNMSLGVKVMKDNRGELSLSVFDVLSENNSVDRSTTETYIQDTETQVLQRYFMINFRYNIKSFKKQDNQTEE